VIAKCGLWEGWESGQMKTSDMLLLKTSSFFAVVFLWSASAPAQPNNWLIVPGKRLGQITPDTTRATGPALW
jgi:hypothetical protein